jgi:hypothetical protein
MKFSIISIEKIINPITSNIFIDKLSFTYGNAIDKVDMKIELIML